MACIDATAPRRAQDKCAKTTWLTKVWHRLHHHWQNRNHPTPPHMNAHMARDIGLSDFELARRQHQLPSQTTHHPRS